MKGLDKDFTHGTQPDTGSRFGLHSPGHMSCCSSFVSSGGVIKVGKKEPKNNMRNGSNRKVGLEIKMAQLLVI